MGNGKEATIKDTIINAGPQESNLYGPWMVVDTWKRWSRMVIKHGKCDASSDVLIWSQFALIVEDNDSGEATARDAVENSVVGGLVVEDIVRQNAPGKAKPHNAEGSVVCMSVAYLQ
ncbi:hypothetical protein V6N13_017038 [Hibiscus sabdariffa]|uniref:Uncharacterized protein n=1 Tax=Hibiscus sabdariffa TaxID=183260 RepID=A0ABR2CZT5_9ROSI